MSAQLSSSKNFLTCAFWSIVTLHIVVWVLIPTFTEHTLSSDNIEAAIWGQQFQWGYDKNPWLVGLLTHLSLALSTTTTFGLTLIKTVFSILAFWSIWQLTSRLTNHAYALLASFMFEACICYHLNVLLYNDNYIILGLWPLSALLFYHIVKTNSWSTWIGCGITLGLATMAKYDSVILLIAYAAYLIFTPQQRKHFLSKKFYSAVLIYLLIIMPNLIWLLQHNFSSLNYAFVERAQLQQISWIEHQFDNLDFLKTVLFNFAPASLILLTGLEFKKNPTSPLLAPPDLSDIATTKRFVFFIGILPFLILLLLGIALGLSLHREWGETLMSFWGTWILLRFQPRVSVISIKRFTAVIVTLVFMLSISYGYATVKLPSETAANYPGPEIAKLVTQIWHEKYSQPLSYVAGNRYVAGYVGIYSEDKPAVFMEWNSKVSPWIDQQQLLCKGAVFVQDDCHTSNQDHIYCKMQFPDAVIKQYPNLIVLPIQTIKWYRGNKTNQLLIGLLPPDPKSCVK